MEIRTDLGWQYAFADLSLILFMVAASGLVRSPAAAHRPAPPVQQPIVAPAVADPVAVWRPGPGMPSLAQWLSGQQVDSRQRLTVVAHYAGKLAAPVSARAAAMLEGARTAGPVRLIVEPGAEDDISATLTWDAGAPAPNGARP